MTAKHDEIEILEYLSESLINVRNSMQNEYNIKAAFELGQIYRTIQLWDKDE